MSGKLASLDVLFDAKSQSGHTFEAIAKHLGRSEVAVAGIFYGQVQASDEDVKKLSELLGVDAASLGPKLTAFPTAVARGPCRLSSRSSINYGYAYKAILNEKFGDGIMSAICFNTSVEKETDEAGNPWVVITLKGKWLPFTRF
ncbi:cyanate hydratase [Colletotrichum liriopes]|uniref:Cyanate hydratase n=1 Tax=Colletotrichum liriopes TaxID=708192 RepID=A0AA37GVR5_9PEZI|nr:cyanate hydratase [Colletotrichum liriopes]